MKTVAVLFLFLIGTSTAQTVSQATPSIPVYAVSMMNYTIGIYTMYGNIFIYPSKTFQNWGWNYDGVSDTFNWWIDFNLSMSKTPTFNVTSDFALGSKSKALASGNVSFNFSSTTPINSVISSESGKSYTVSTTSLTSKTGVYRINGTISRLDACRVGCSVPGDGITVQVFTGGAFGVEIGNKWLMQMYVRDLYHSCFLGGCSCTPQTDQTGSAAQIPVSDASKPIDSGGSSTNNPKTNCVIYTTYTVGASAGNPGIQCHQVSSGKNVRTSLGFWTSYWTGFSCVHSPPVVTISTPANNSYLSSYAVQVNCTATSLYMALGEGYMQLFDNRSGSFSQQNSTCYCDSSPCTCNKLIYFTTNGNYSIRCGAWDDNSYNTNSTIQVNISVTAPSNTAPNASSVVLLNNTAGALGTPYKNNPTYFNASGNCSDAENATLTGNFTFYLNSSAFGSYLTYNWAANQTNYTNTSATGLNKSDTLKVGLTCYDGSQYSTQSNSSAVTVNNTAPVIGTPTINNTSPLPGATLLCVNSSYSDADSDAIGTGRWRWFLNNSVLAGQTAQSLSLAAVGANSSDFINCSYKTEDSGYDVKNSTEMFSSNVTVIDIVPPVLTFTDVTPPDHANMQTNNLTIQITANEALNVSTLTFNGVNYTMTGGPTLWAYSLTNVPIGTYIYFVTANDTSNNTGYSAVRAVTVGSTGGGGGAPTYVCIDGTPWYNCSIVTEGLYCNRGLLVENESCAGIKAPPFPTSWWDILKSYVPEPVRGAVSYLKNGALYWVGQAVSFVEHSLPFVADIARYLRNGLVWAVTWLYDFVRGLQAWVCIGIIALFVILILLVTDFRERKKKKGQK